MNKPNLPEEIGLGKMASWRASMKAGAPWMFAVYLTDIPGAYLLSRNEDWPAIFRAVVAMAPLMASLLYVRSLARWIGGMDEMHRRVTQSAFLFATVAYLLLSAAWDLLKRTGLFDAISGATDLHFELMPFSNCTFIICLTYILWGIGYSKIFNRCYR
jgi:hypothetical protein